MHRNSRNWILITGASAGIGEAFARRFAREGWNLVLVARSRKRLEALREELEERHAIQAHVIEMDLTKEDAVRRIFEETNHMGLEIEGLINNAGSSRRGKFFETGLDDYLKVAHLNIRALMELTHRYGKEMVKRKRGFIINVSSTASFQPLPYTAVYAATKAFVTFFTEALWMELKGVGVRVLNLCPGLTKTGFGIAAGYHDFRQDSFAQRPEEVVETAFRALNTNQPTVISGFQNRLLYYLARLAPHRLLLWALPWVQVMRKRV